MDSATGHPINHLSHRIVIAHLPSSTNLWHCSSREGLHPSRESRRLDLLIHIFVLEESHLLQVNHSSLIDQVVTDISDTPNAVNIVCIMGRSVVDVISVGKRVKYQEDRASQIVGGRSVAKVIKH
jgi:hypothetical protein